LRTITWVGTGVHGTVRHVPRLLFACALSAFVLVATAPAASAANPWLHRRVLDIAHQGGEDEYPSNTIYAFRQALKAGADMLELDVGITKDDQVIVMHDTSVDRTTSGTGLISRRTLKQIRRLDGAYWFAPARSQHYGHDYARSAYRFRGVATGKRKPPKGFKARDFRVPTLSEVLTAFPKVPINIEIKGRTKAEEVAEYVYNAEVLAKLLKHTKRRDLIVVSFKQAAVDRFHELVPKLDVAPGVDGSAAYLLGGTSPGPGVAAFQLPITYTLNGTTLQVTTPENVARAHKDGYAWHTWFGDGDVDGPASWASLVNGCVDGVMTAKPRAFAHWAKSHPAPASC
jgi:glycerophosphoryl diester phosphodiesterase